MVDAQSSNLSTVLPKLNRFPSRTTILNATVDKLRECHRNISEQGLGSKVIHLVIRAQFSTRKNLLGLRLHL